MTTTRIQWGLIGGSDRGSLRGRDLILIVLRLNGQYPFCNLIAVLELFTLALRNALFCVELQILLKLFLG